MFAAKKEGNGTFRRPVPPSGGEPRLWKNCDFATCRFYTLVDLNEPGLRNGPGFNKETGGTEKIVVIQRTKQMLFRGTVFIHLKFGRIVPRLDRFARTVIMR